MYLWSESEGVEEEERERECTSSLMSLHIRALIPSEGPTLMTSSNSNYFLKAPSPNTIALGG